MTDAPSQSGSDLPVACTAPATRPWWVWLIPALAAVFALVLASVYYAQRGHAITVVLSQGHGVEVGTAVRCRGIVIGKVENVRLSEDFTQVEAIVRLEPDASGIARAGSRFWLVRPRVNVNEISGLETLAGARYLSAVPGDGPRQGRFIALDEPPAIETLAPDGLEIHLTAHQRGSVLPGTMILYRQVPIGTVLSVGLAGDAASVELRAYIEPAYAPLVRENSRFWNVSGVGVDLGFGGLKLQVDSLQTVLAGGIAMATPDRPGEPVRTGRRFELHPQPEPEWLAWQPRISIGAELLPAGAPRPEMIRATVSTTSGRFLSRTTEHRGWLLPTEGGLLAPAPFIPQGDAAIELLGRRMNLLDLDVDRLGELARIRFPEAVHELSAWPAERMRVMNEPEDCVICADPAAAPLPLAAARLQPAEAGFTIDPSLSLESGLTGAAVLSRRDGRLVGILTVTRDAARVVNPPTESDATGSEASLPR